jgi:hypothetical protein
LINFASFGFREYLNTSVDSDGYRGALAFDITGSWRRSLSLNAAASETVDPLPASQAWDSA